MDLTAAVLAVALTVAAALAVPVAVVHIAAVLTAEAHTVVVLAEVDMADVDNKSLKNIR